MSMAWKVIVSKLVGVGLVYFTRILGGHEIKLQGILI